MLTIGLSIAAGIVIGAALLALYATILLNEM